MSLKNYLKIASNEKRLSTASSLNLCVTFSSERSTRCTEEVQQNKKLVPRVCPVTNNS